MHWNLAGLAQTPVPVDDHEKALEGRARETINAPGNVEAATTPAHKAGA